MEVNALLKTVFIGGSILVASYASYYIWKKYTEIDFNSQEFILYNLKGKNLDIYPPSLQNSFAHSKLETFFDTPPRKR
jgi:hypothetical protein